MSLIKILEWFSSKRGGMVTYLSIGVFVVMAWIGGLKAFQYEADGIVPFGANSPFFSYMYKNADTLVDNGHGKMVKAYTLHKNPEGAVVPKNIEWHKENGTYTFSYLLGAVIVSIGILVLLGIWFPTLGFIGGLLTFGMSIVTLSLLITTPETWVPNLGNPALGITESPNHGFPYLSGAGRLVIKDSIMSGAGLVIASSAAERMFRKLKSKQEQKENI